MFKRIGTGKSSVSQAARAAHKSRVWLRTLAALVLLVAMAACQAAPTATKMPLAPPEPAATSTPDLSADPEDLAGWWKLSTSLDATMHVEPDGTWGMFDVPVEFLPVGSRTSGPMERGSWRKNEVGWELRLAKGPLVNQACADSVNLHEIQLLSKDSVRTILVGDLTQDPCGLASSHKEVTWTRATQLEQLLCAWQAEGEQDATVAFRSDLTYAAWHGPSAEEGQVVWGKLIWNQPLGQIELKDHAASPCGPSKVGKYKLSIGADGKLTLETVEDLCAERRQALTGWGPFQRSDAYTKLAGRYVGVDQPKYELLLTGCGTQRVRLLPDQGEDVLRAGTFAIDGNQLQFVDLRGDARCPEESGAYAYTLEGDTLKLEAVADACQARKDIVAACSTWTRIGNQ